MESRAKRVDAVLTAEAERVQKTRLVQARRALARRATKI